jgi:NADH:ubiquinone oxidoreductase subunit 6 (subunit J)
MNLYNFVFYFFEFAAAVSALSLMFTRSVFYGALLLITALLSVAGLYVLSFAEFVAVTQIMVYAGGVLVLIIFGIMLTVRLGEKPLTVGHGNLFSAVLICAALFVILVIFLKFPEAAFSKEHADENVIERIGINLMTEYLVPFEIAAMLLLASLIGAAVIASNKSHQP